MRPSLGLWGMRGLALLRVMGPLGGTGGASSSSLNLPCGGSLVGLYSLQRHEHGRLDDGLRSTPWNIEWINEEEDTREVNYIFNNNGEEGRMSSEAPRGKININPIKWH